MFAHFRGPRASALEHIVLSADDLRIACNHRSAADMELTAMPDPDRSVCVSCLRAVELIGRTKLRQAGRHQASDLVPRDVMVPSREALAAFGGPVVNGVVAW